MDNPQFLVVDASKKLVIFTGEQTACVVCEIANVPFELYHD